MFFAPAADIITADILLPQTAALWAAHFCSTLQKFVWPVRLTSTICLLISYHTSACTAIRALCTDKLLNSSSSSWFESLISSVRSSWRYDAPLETWRQEHTFNFHSAHRYSVSAVPLDQYNSGQLTQRTQLALQTNKHNNYHMMDLCPETSLFSLLAQYLYTQNQKQGSQNQYLAIRMWLFGRLRFIPL